MLLIVLGIVSGSFWFGSISLYYFSLATMRFFLLRYSLRRDRSMAGELARQRLAGYLLLPLTLALAMMIFFMVRFGRSFHHHEITAIALAAYTFTAFTVATVGIWRERGRASPLAESVRAIDLISATVSMLTLTATLTTAFGGDMTRFETGLLLGALGGATVILVIIGAIWMIARGKRTKINFKENDDVNRKE